MLDKFRNISLGISFLLFVLLVGVILLIKTGSGELIGISSKDGQLRQTDITNLNHQPGIKGYLACLPSICTGSIPDRPALVYNVEVRRLRKAVSNITDHSPLMKVIHLDLANGQFDITVKTKGKSFPDLVTIKIIPSDTGALVVFYSRAVIGDPTPSIDADRFDKWQREITAQLRAII